MPERTALNIIRKGLTFVNKSFNMAVLAVIIGAIAISIYALTDISRVIVNGSSTQYEKYKPREDKKSFEELIVLNPEVIGWITVYGTAIDYPITQAKDNDKYLMLGPDLQYSLLGSIFLDAGNEPDFSDFNNILYGHNMTPRAMFGNVKDYKDEAYFLAHRYGDLYYGGTHHGLEFFAIFEEDGYSGFLKRLKFNNDEEKQTYLDSIFKRALVTMDVKVTVSDKLVMLYTCSNAETNGRELLVGRITDRTFENTFVEAERDWGFLGGLKKFPMWIWPYLILLLLLLILLWIKHREARKEQRERENISP